MCITVMKDPARMIVHLQSEINNKCRSRLRSVFEGRSRSCYFTLSLLFMMTIARIYNGYWIDKECMQRQTHGHDTVQISGNATAD